MEEGNGHVSLENFLKWAAKLGISDSPNCLHSENPSCLGQSLFISQFPDAGGRGLAAAHELRKGELILRVPKSALMTRESILKDQKLSVFVKKYPYLSPTQILTVCLLAELHKGKGSWWYPYLLQLPRSYDTLSSFGRFETQALQVEDAIWATEKAVSKAEFEWEEAISLMKALELRPQFLTFGSWLWASATISSRTLHIPWDDSGSLCPVGDFFNYAAPEEESFQSEDVESQRQASPLQASSLGNDESVEKLDTEQFDVHSQRLTDGGYEEDVDAYCFYARKRYKKGEQVLLSYGTYTNLELLEHYGFLLNSNPNDKVFIHLEPGIQSASSWPKDSLYIQQDGMPSFALLSALRLWATPSNQRRSVGHLAYSGSQLSTENEISITRWMAKNCHLILEKLPSSAEEDVLLLDLVSKIQECSCPEEIEKMVLAYGGEVLAFFKANVLQKGGGKCEFLLSRKTRRSMDRWKLAIQWRLRYKEILLDSISYCTETLNYLSSQQVSSSRTNKFRSFEICENC